MASVARSLGGGQWRVIKRGTSVLRAEEQAARDGPAVLCTRRTQSGVKAEFARLQIERRTESYPADQLMELPSFLLVRSGATSRERQRGRGGHGQGNVQY